MSNRLRNIEWNWQRCGTIQGKYRKTNNHRPSTPLLQIGRARRRVGSVLCGLRPSVLASFYSAVKIEKKKDEE
jgi:hypothetical protein